MWPVQTPLVNKIFLEYCYVSFLERLKKMLNLVVMYREVPLTLFTNKLMDTRHFNISGLLVMQ